MIVPPPRPRPADAAGGSAHPGPPLEPVAGSDLAAAPADAWSSLCEGVQQDMMLAMLGAFQGVAAACAEVCIQRMQLMHLELTRAVEHEVEEAEATARRDGHPSNAPILHSLADALGQKTRLGQLCHQEPCMSEKHMSGCQSNTTLESIYKHLGGNASPETAELFKFVVSEGSGATSANREPSSFLERTPSHKECHIRHHDSDPMKHDSLTLTPRCPDSDPTKHDIPTRTPPRPDWTPRSEEGGHPSEEHELRFVSAPLFPGGRRVCPDYCNGGDLDLLSETDTKTESKTDWHYSASSSSWDQLPQTPQVPPQRANRCEMPSAPGGPHGTTGVAYHDSPGSRDLGSDTVVHAQGGLTVVPMAGSIPVHPQPTQLGQGPMVMPMNGAYQWHAQIREAHELSKEQPARDQVQQLSKEQNFFYA